MQQSNNFDGLRLVGALLVLISHQFALSGRPEPESLHTTAGTLGVLIFFSISGYLIAGSWRADPSLWRFSARRFLRIWPALAAVVLITAAAGWRSPEAARYLRNLYLLGRVDGPFFPGNPHKELNGALWTIPMEVICYAALALTALVSGKRLHLVLVTSAVTVIPLFMLAFGTDLLSGSVPAGPAFLPYFGSYFLAGAALQFVRASTQSLVMLSLLGVGSQLVGATALGLVLIIPAVCVALGRMSSPLLRDAGRFGDLSYGIYLWAWPVQQVGVAILGRERSVPLLASCTLAAVLLLSWLSWHLVEKQALMLKPRPRSMSNNH